MSQRDLSACLQSLAALILAVTVVRADSSAVAAPQPEAIEFFEKRVRPILAENCFSCHGQDKQKAGLRLDSRADGLRLAHVTARGPLVGVTPK